MFRHDVSLSSLLVIDVIDIFGHMQVRKFYELVKFLMERVISRPFSILKLTLTVEINVDTWTLKMSQIMIAVNKN